jgi:hypothetical protein
MDVATAVAAKARMYIVIKNINYCDPEAPFRMRSGLLRGQS